MVDAAARGSSLGRLPELRDTLIAYLDPSASKTRNDVQSADLSSAVTTAQKALLANELSRVAAGSFPFLRWVAWVPAKLASKPEFAENAVLSGRRIPTGSRAIQRQSIGYQLDYAHAAQLHVALLVRLCCARSCNRLL